MSFRWISGMASALRRPGSAMGEVPMGWRLPTVPAIAALLLVSLISDAPAGLPPTATDDTWIEATTARFRILSNAGETNAAHAARNLERLADAMERLQNGLRVDASHRACVYVFRDQGSFKPYVGSAGDEYSTTGGYHVAGSDVDYIAYYLPPDRSETGFAAHEFTHSAVSRTLGELPVWANEGLAEYFSTFQSESKRAQIGRSRPGQTEWLREHLLPLGFLLLVGQNSPEYSRGPNRATVYAESWALVHMLILDGADEGGRFDTLLGRLAAGVPSGQALEEVYGPNAVDSLESRLRHFSQQPAVAYMNYTFDTEFDQASVQIRTLDRGEALIVLGELLAHADETLGLAAANHLHAAWAADSTRVLTAALLGELAERQGRPAETDRWFDAVMGAASKEPRAPGIAGHVLARRGSWSSEPPRWPAPGADHDARRARSLLENALAVEPDNSTWLADYGMTFLDDSTDLSRGFGALVQAQQNWPYRSDIVGAQSILMLRQGNRGAAMALYNRIPSGSDKPYWRWKAGGLIALATRQDVLALARNGRAAEAESLIVRLHRDVNERGVARMCDELLRYVHER